MKKRVLGKRNPAEVSILGFGCMRLPVVDGVYKNIDIPLAKKQVRYAIDQGLNYIDTAWPYHGGNSEAFVAEVLKDGYREKVYIADKLPSWAIKTREDMDYYLNEQLKRLKTDYIDYYLIHTLNSNYWDNLTSNGLFDFIEKALASGKIRNIGFSFHDDYPVFEKIIKSYDWDFCQIQMNFYDEAYQAGLKGLKLAGEMGIGVIIMEPLRGGRLATNVPQGVIDIYKSTGKEFTPAGWALRYLWNYAEVKLILSGMNDYNHIDDNISTARKAEIDMLTDIEAKAIKKVDQFYKARIQVDCTDCKYCMPCPHGVDIPGNFRYYNNAHIFDSKEKTTGEYRSYMADSSMADKCLQCGECEPKCPQNIEIINELIKVTEYFKN